MCLFVYIYTYIHTLTYTHTYTHTFHIHNKFMALRCGNAWAELSGLDF